LEKTANEAQPGSRAGLRKSAQPLTFTLENTMTPQQIVGLFVRILAIWLVVSAIQLIGVGAALDDQQMPEKTLVPYIISGILVIFAIALWLFPMAVAHKLIPRSQIDNTLSVSAHEAAVVVCIALGLWLFVAKSLPLLTQYISVAALVNNNNQSLAIEMGASYNTRLILGLVELVASVILTFQSA